MAMTHAAQAEKALTITPMTGGPGLRLIGEVDLATGPVLAAALDELVRGGGDVHLDLAELQFVDVSGASVVVAAAAALGSGRTLVLHRPPAVLSQILDRFWPGADRIRVDWS